MIEELKRNLLFARLTEAQLKRVATRAQRLRLDEGEALFEQGDPADLVYVIKSGEVDVFRVLADGGEEHLNRLGPDQYFGELGPFLGFPRSASCRAHTDVVLTAYSPRVFREKVLHKN